jgi:hypothetical protein
MPFCGSDLAPPVSEVRTVPRRWLLDPLGITFTFFLVNGALDLSTTELALFMSGGVSLNYCREAVRTVVRSLEDWSPPWSNREGNDAVINNVPRTFVDQVSFT